MKNATEKTKEKDIIPHVHSKSTQLGNNSNYISQKSQNVKLKKIETLKDFKELFEEIFQKHNFEWHGNENRYTGRCPFHDDTHPSFNIFKGDAGLLYKCWSTSCGVTGTVNSLLKYAYENASHIAKQYSYSFKSKKVVSKEELKKMQEQQDSIQQFIKVAQEQLLSLLKPEQFKKIINEITIEEIKENTNIFIKRFQNSSTIDETIRNLEKTPENAVLRLIVKLLKHRIAKKEFTNELIEEIREHLVEMVNYFKIGLITEEIIKEKINDKAGEFETFEDFFKELGYDISYKKTDFICPYYTAATEIPFVKLIDFWTKDKKRWNIFKNFNGLALFGWLGVMERYMEEVKKDDTEKPFPAFVCEGESDTMTLFIQGLKEKLGRFVIFGVSNSNEIPKLSYFKYFDDFFLTIFPDLDEPTMKSPGAGQNAIIRLAEAKNIKNIEKYIFVLTDKEAYKGGKDVNDAILKGANISKDLVNNTNIENIIIAKDIFEEKWLEFKRKEHEKIKDKYEKHGLENFAELYSIVYSLPVTIEIEKTEKISSVETFTKEEVQLDFVLDGFLQGTVGLLSAPGSTGKSFFALQTAISVAIENIKDFDYNFAKIVRTKGKVLYLSIEDPRLIIEKRMQNIYSYLCSKIFTLKKEDFVEHFLKKVDENLEIISLFGEKFNIYGEDEIFTGEYNKKCIEFIKRRAKGKKLVILDTLSRVHIADENSNADMSALLKIFENIASETGASILLLHHTSKEATFNKRADQTALRGASALISNSRFGISLTKDESEENKLTLTFAKINYSQVPEKITLFRNEGGVLDTIKWDNCTEEVEIDKDEKNRKGMFEDEEESPLPNLPDYEEIKDDDII